MHVNIYIHTSIYILYQGESEIMVYFFTKELDSTGFFFSETVVSVFTFLNKKGTKQQRCFISDLHQTLRVFGEECLDPCY
jgi:hypothetical protein